MTYRSEGVTARFVIIVLHNGRYNRSMYIEPQDRDRYNIFTYKRREMIIETFSTSTTCGNLDVDVPLSKVETMIVPFSLSNMTFDEILYDPIGTSSSRAVVLHCVSNMHEAKQYIESIQDEDKKLRDNIDSVNIDFVHAIFLEMYSVVIADRVSEIGKLVNSIDRYNRSKLIASLFDPREIDATIAWTNTLLSKYLMIKNHRMYTCTYIIHTMYKEKYTSKHALKRDIICDMIYTDEYIENIYMKGHLHVNLANLPSKKVILRVVDVDILCNSGKFIIDTIQIAPRDMLDTCNAILDKTPSYVITTEEEDYINDGFILAVQVLDVRIANIVLKTVSKSRLYSVDKNNINHISIELTETILQQYDDQAATKAYLYEVADTLGISLTTKPILTKISDMIKAKLREDIQFEEILSPRRRSVVFSANSVHTIPNRDQADQYLSDGDD